MAVTINAAIGISDDPLLAQRPVEIGYGSARCASRRHVAEQFLVDAVLLAVLGGVAGTVIGLAATGTYPRSQDWSLQIPLVALYGGVGAALSSVPSPACTL